MNIQQSEEILAVQLVTVPAPPGGRAQPRCILAKGKVLGDDPVVAFRYGGNQAHTLFLGRVDSDGYHSSVANLTSVAEVYCPFHFSQPLLERKVPHPSPHEY